MVEDKVPLCGPMMGAGKRYTRDFLIAMVAYALAVIGLTLAVKLLHPPLWATIPLALVPLLPLMAALRAFLVHFRAMDELQRRIHSEALLLAMTIVGFGTLAYGLLEGFADFPHLDVIFVFPAMIMVYGVATAFVSRRYR